jgi:alanine racemase
LNPQTERTWAEISPDNILHNMRAIRNSCPAGTKFLGVVKANAYGHGALTVARALEANGADYLAVACLPEAIELREAGVGMPILILGVTPPEDAPALLQYDITQAAADTESAAAYSAAALAAGGRLRVHIKTDTGMSRLGFLCDEAHIPESVEAIAAVCALPGLTPEGIFMHFAVSDEPGAECEAYTRRQFARFTAVIDALAARGIRFAIRHCAATGGTLYYPDFALDMVRPGILLYGYGDPARKLGLLPGMTLKSRICAVKRYPAGTRISYGGTYTCARETRMGVIPVGYADGLHRLLSNKAAFWTKDGFAPQRGRICMDMCMIDLTELPGVGVGDEVEVFGEHVDLEDLAAKAGTISYELLCAVSPRVPRVIV